MSKEQIFLTESEHAVQKIAHACARANNSSNPVLDVALAIEEIVYEKAQDVAGDLEIWESEHAMMVYKQICSTLIARLPSVRRLCSARPSLLVEKLLKTPADGAMAERQISKPNKPQSMSCKQLYSCVLCHTTCSHFFITYITQMMVG